MTSGREYTSRARSTSRRERVEVPLCEYTYEYERDIEYIYHLERVFIVVHHTVLSDARERRGTSVCEYTYVYER